MNKPEKTYTITRICRWTLSEEKLKEMYEEDLWINEEDEESWPFETWLDDSVNETNINGYDWYWYCDVKCDYETTWKED